MMLARCPKCNKEVEVDTSVVLTSNPPMYNLDCPFCGRQYVFYKDCYEASIDNTTIEQDILRRIEELEKYQQRQDRKIKQLEEKVTLASIGFPVNLFG